MTEQKRWFRAWLVSLGECAFWSDPGNLETLKIGRFEVGNLTQILLSPQGAALRKLTDKAKIASTHVVAITECPEDLAKDLSRVWDGTVGNGNLAIPDWKTKKRLGL